VNRFTHRKINFGVTPIPAAQTGSAEKMRQPCLPIDAVAMRFADHGAESRRAFVHASAAWRRLLSIGDRRKLVRKQASHFVTNVMNSRDLNSRKCACTNKYTNSCRPLPNLFVTGKAVRNHRCGLELLLYGRDHMDEAAFTIRRPWSVINVALAWPQGYC
jgi:hypothetical protein